MQKVLVGEAEESTSDGYIANRARQQIQSSLLYNLKGLSGSLGLWYGESGLGRELLLLTLSRYLKSSELAGTPPYSKDYGQAMSSEPMSHMLSADIKFPNGFKKDITLLGPVCIPYFARSQVDENKLKWNSGIQIPLETHLYNSIIISWVGSELSANNDIDMVRIQRVRLQQCLYIVGI